MSSLSGLPIHVSDRASFLKAGEQLSQCQYQSSHQELCKRCGEAMAAYLQGVGRHDEASHSDFKHRFKPIVDELNHTLESLLLHQASSAASSFASSRPDSFSADDFLSFESADALASEKLAPADCFDDRVKDFGGAASEKASFSPVLTVEENDLSNEAAEQAHGSVSSMTVDDSEPDDFLTLGPPRSKAHLSSPADIDADYGEFKYARPKRTEERVKFSEHSEVRIIEARDEGEASVIWEDANQASSAAAASSSSYKPADVPGDISSYQPAAELRAGDQSSEIPVDKRFFLDPSGRDFFVKPPVTASKLENLNNEAYCLYRKTLYLLGKDKTHDAVEVVKQMLKLPFRSPFALLLINRLIDLLGSEHAGLEEKFSSLLSSFEDATDPVTLVAAKCFHASKKELLAWFIDLGLEGADLQLDLFEKDFNEWKVSMDGHTKQQRLNDSLV